MSFDDWFNKAFINRKMSWQIPKYSVIKLAWDYQQIKIDKLKDKIKGLENTIHIIETDTMFFKWEMDNEQYKRLLKFRKENLKESNDE